MFNFSPSYNKIVSDLMERGLDDVWTNFKTK